MKKKIFNVLLILILLVGLTGCGNSVEKKEEKNNSKTEEKVSNEPTKEDNQEIVNLLNDTVSKLLDYSKTNEYKVFRPQALYHVEDKLKEDGINNYMFLALCDKKFTEKVELEEFAYKEEMIPNYKGSCVYDMWQFADLEYNKGDDRYVMLKDKNTDEYYNIKITFKKTKHYDKDKYYPIFSNSELLN